MKNPSITNPKPKIPSHWVEAGKMYKKIHDSFLSTIDEKEFMASDYHKRYDWYDKNNKLYIVLRHTKKWSAMYQERDDKWGYIAVNINDDAVESENPMLNGLKNVLSLTITHELLHHFQYAYGIHDTDNAHYMKLAGSSFKSDKNSFLYATNWKEMDAEVGAIYTVFHFIPNYKQMLSFYQAWYGKGLGQMIGDYVYNFMVLGNKMTDFRNKVWQGITKIPNFNQGTL